MREQSHPWGTVFQDRVPRFQLLLGFRTTFVKITLRVLDGLRFQATPCFKNTENWSHGAKALLEDVVRGPFGQFQHFQRKFKHFEFFRHLKRRETHFAEKWGIRPQLYLLICQNLTSIPESSLKTCCERTSFFRHFL